MKSMAQKVAMAFGIVFLLIGVIGLFVPNGMGMDADMETTGKIFGLFPVNLLHNVVHIAFGLWGLAAARSIAGTVTYGRVGAAVYAVLVLLAFVDPEMFGLVPIGGHDIWLHAVLAAGLAWLGFATPATTATTA